MQNPYEPPQWRDARFKDDAQAAPPDLRSTTNLVRHVGIVAILMIVQGSLEILMSLFYFGIAAALPGLMRFAAENNPNKFEPPEMAEAELMFQVGMGVYAVIGFVLAAIGAMRVFVGRRNYRFRNRTLGIVTMAVGTVTTFACNCVPTSIALAVYGLIVFLNPHVQAAFDGTEAVQSEDKVRDGGSPFGPSQP